jgi:hypothetical protein
MAPVQLWGTTKDPSWQNISPGQEWIRPPFQGGALTSIRQSARRYPHSMSVVGFTVVCDSPECPSIFALDSHEHLTIASFATVIGDRMEAAGWTKSQHGNDLCPDCSHRPG